MSTFFCTALVRFNEECSLKIFYFGYKSYGFIDIILLSLGCWMKEAKRLFLDQSLSYALIWYSLMQS